MVKSTARTGRETKLRLTDDSRASPSTVERSSGRVVIDVLMVWGTSGWPASFNVPADAYAVTRDLCGRRSDAMPLTEISELLGGTDRRPRDGVAGVSVSLNGLSKTSESMSLWNQDPL